MRLNSSRARGFSPLIDGQFSKKENIFILNWLVNSQKMHSGKAVHRQTFTGRAFQAFSGDFNRFWHRSYPYYAKSMEKMRLYFKDSGMKSAIPNVLLAIYLVIVLSTLIYQVIC
jgi:hypothetical protein